VRVARARVEVSVDAGRGEPPLCLLERHHLAVVVADDAAERGHVGVVPRALPLVAAARAKPCEVEQRAALADGARGRIGEEVGELGRREAVLVNTRRVRRLQVIEAGQEDCGLDHGPTSKMPSARECNLLVRSRHCAGQGRAPVLYSLLVRVRASSASTAILDHSRLYVV
jgi:signal transduction protein with GAF and PtsI domain